jgi:Putative auto-transporter adhesin, head GIN domain
MKKQILVTLVLMVSVFTTAFAENNSNVFAPASKKVPVKKEVTKIVVEGNVDVVLFEDEGAAIYMFGNTNTTTVSENNGVLTVRNSKTTGEKTLVYVPVKNVKEIEAKGNAKVSSAAPLNTDELTVYVNGDCNIDLKVTGKVNLVEGDGTEMIVETFRERKGKDTAHL